MTKMTTAQQNRAEAHYSLVYDFLCNNDLPESRYDDVLEGFLEAVQAYEPSLARVEPFEDFAQEYMHLSVESGANPPEAELVPLHLVSGSDERTINHQLYSDQELAVLLEMQPSRCDPDDDRPAAVLVPRPFGGDRLAA